MKNTYVLIYKFIHIYKKIDFNIELFYNFYKSKEEEGEEEEMFLPCTLRFRII